MRSKKSKAELIRLVEAGIEEVGGTEKLSLLVRDLIVKGSPPDKFTIFLTVRFLSGAAPFCCGEPACYSKLFSTKGEQQLAEYLRREMNLDQDISLDIKSDVQYFDGIEFTDLK
jgi:hypothetical protein